MTIEAGRAYQPCLFNYSKDRIHASDPSLLLETIETSPKPVVVFFDGIYMMHEYSCALQETLRARNGTHIINRLHFHHLLFPGSWMDTRFNGYSTSAIFYSELPRIIIVDECQSFNEKCFETVLRAIDEAPNSIKWVLLVPTWGSNIRPSDILTEWLQKNNPPQFCFDH